MNNELYKKYVYDFTSLNHKLDLAIQTCKDYGEYYQTRGTLEIEYGKKIEDIIEDIHNNEH